jgi:hypothetical protein
MPLIGNRGSGRRASVEGQSCSASRPEGERAAKLFPPLSRKTALLPHGCFWSGCVNRTTRDSPAGRRSSIRCCPPSNGSSSATSKPIVRVENARARSSPARRETPKSPAWNQAVGFGPFAMPRPGTLIRGGLACFILYSLS